MRVQALGRQGSQTLVRGLTQLHSCSLVSVRMGDQVSTLLSQVLFSCYFFKILVLNCMFCKIKTKILLSVIYFIRNICMWGSLTSASSSGSQLVAPFVSLNLQLCLV